MIKSRILKKLQSIVDMVKIINFQDDTAKIKKSDILLFCHDADRGASLNGKAYSPLLDSVREDLEERGLSCQVIAHPWSLLTGSKACGDPIAMNRSYLFSKLFLKIESMLNQKLLFLKRNIYNNILRSSGTKLIITIGSNDDLCSAARNLGVFHTELLHGIGYKHLVWGWDKKKPEFLPQGILSLDELSTQAFSPLEKFGICIKTIPHPFLKRFLKKTTLHEEWIYFFNHEKSYKKHIMISMEWGYSGDHGQYIHFANILKNGLFYEEIAEIVSEEKDVFWHFRFHPVQLRQKKYRGLMAFMDKFVSENSNSEWLMSSHLPYPSIVTQCQGNISMTSMSCYDAAAMGVPSLMLGPAILPGGIYENYFIDLVQEGYVTKKAVSKEGIKGWLQNLKKQPPRISNLKDEDAWEDAVKWMLTSSGLGYRAKPRVT